MAVVSGPRGALTLSERPDSGESGTRHRDQAGRADASYDTPGPGMMPQRQTATGGNACHEETVRAGSATGRSSRPAVPEIPLARKRSVRAYP